MGFERVEEFSKKKRGKRRNPLPSDAPLYARKMMELLEYFGWPSDEEFGEPIGAKHDEVWKWHRGKKEPSKKDKIAIAHEYDIPREWWDNPHQPIQKVINKGLGKDESSQVLHATPIKEQELPADRNSTTRATLHAIIRMAQEAARDLEQGTRGGKDND